MAALTAEERTQLEALQKRHKEEEQAEASAEVWVRTKQGHEVKLTGSKARKLLSQFDDDDDQTDADDVDQADDVDPDDPPAGGAGYFKSRGK